MKLYFVLVIIFIFNLAEVKTQPDTAYCDNIEECHSINIYGHVDCVERYCKCTRGSFYVGNFCSYNLTDLGSECTYNEDCVVENSICYRDKSKSECDEEDPVFIDKLKKGIEKGMCPWKCACKPNFVSADEKKCIRTAKLNEACIYSIQCPQEGSIKAVCDKKVCRCPEETTEYDSKCYRRPGDLCEDESDCLHPAICKDKKCNCNSKYYYEEDGECLTLKKYSEKCDKDIECGKNRICFQNTCTCTEKYHFNTKRSNCIKNKSIGEPCTKDDQCEWNNSEDNMHCRNLTCTCDKEYKPAENLRSCVLLPSNNSKDSVDSPVNRDVSTSKNGTSRITPKVYITGLFLGLMLIIGLF